MKEQNPPARKAKETCGLILLCESVVASVHDYDDLEWALQLAHVLEMEVKHRCKQVLEMGFSAFGLAKLFAQDWEGDVTIVMPATFAQVKSTLLVMNCEHEESDL